MFAYVRFIDDDVCKYVATEKIKKFNAESIIYNKKYMVEWEDDKEYYQAQIIHVRDSMEELRNVVHAKRVLFLNKNFLHSDISSQEEEKDNSEKKGSSRFNKPLTTKKKVNENKGSNTKLEHSILNKFKEISGTVTSASNATDKQKSDSITNLDDLIANLKKEIEEKDMIIKDLTSLNIQLQRDVININKELVSKLNLDKPDGILEKQAYKVGELTAGGEIHLGQGIFLKKEIYDSVRTLSSTNSQFVKNMALAVFGAKILKESSVTGRKSNRIKKCDARPALNSSKLQAIHDIYKHHLVQLGTSEVLVNVYVQKVGSYIARKISDLRRTKYEKPQEASSENEETEDSDETNFFLEENQDDPNGGGQPLGIL